MRSPELTLSQRSVLPQALTHSQKANISPTTSASRCGRSRVPAAAQDALARFPDDPWFSSLAPELRRELMCAASPLALKAGQLLCRRGDKPRGFYGVKEGSLKVSTVCEDGRESVLGLLGPGNWFGEASLVQGSARAHDVTAITEAALIVVAPPAFNGLMQRPAFAQAVSVLLAGRVRRLYDALEDSMLRSLRAQVARRLVHLAQGDAAAADGPTGRAIVPVSQEVLATMLGVTRQTLAKELQALAAAGCIAQQYGRIAILSIEALKASAGQA